MGFGDNVDNVVRCFGVYRLVVLTILDPSKQRCNNTNINKTDYSNTNLIYQEDDENR